MIILAYFSKNLTNHALLFRALGRKTQIVGEFWEKFEIFWWKFYRKIEYFNFNFAKFVTKNRALGNNTVFLQQFFRFRGGGDFPLATPLSIGISYIPSAYFLVFLFTHSRIVDFSLFRTRIFGTIVA